MSELNDISKKLLSQLERFEKSASNATNRLKEVETYINKRLQKARGMLPSMEGHSEGWMAKLSLIIDILEEIQRILDKMEDVGASVEPLDEVFMDVEKFTNDFAIANF
jgi:uncharacterized protein Yka (UPF0111/DUF47 family)